MIYRLVKKRFQNDISDREKGLTGVQFRCYVFYRVTRAVVIMRRTCETFAIRYKDVMIQSYIVGKGFEVALGKQNIVDIRVFNIYNKYRTDLVL